MDDKEKDSLENLNQKFRQQGQTTRPDNSARQTENRRSSNQGSRQQSRSKGSSRSGSTGRRNNSQQHRRRSRRARRRRRNVAVRIILLILIIVLAVGGIFIWRRYGATNEKADLNSYFGLNQEDDLAVIVNDQIIQGSDSSTPAGKIYDGVAYLEYSVVRDFINERFYWDPNENIMLYTLPNGNVSVEVGSTDYTDIAEKKTKDYVILKTEGRTAYIALSFIQEYTNLDFSIYEDPNRAVINDQWGEIQVASVKRDTQVRYQGGVKSPILTEVKKSDEVTVLEDENDWKKVATEDGFIGYVKTDTLRKITTETTSREFTEPDYTNISVNGTINMAWHNVDNDDANSYVLEMIAGTKGLTVIAPTWFNIADTEGNMTSLANSDYVNYAHQSNLQVWATLRDFDGGINSYDETYEVLSYTSKRENLINQLIAAALQSGIDGINLDFELISQECGEHYIQFVRELSVKCRQNGLVYSIDDYVPQAYNEHYDLKEQGVMADYVVIMAYDEHTEGSEEAGSVSSYPFVVQGIEDALEEVPAEKLIEGVPLYSRLWFETMSSGGESSEDGSGTVQVSSTAIGMDEEQEVLQQAGVTANWDEECQQNYASWEADGGIYKIWLEDTTSLAEKLKLIKDYHLAGVAEWKLGWESSDVWDLILQYVN